MPRSGPIGSSVGGGGRERTVFLCVCGFFLCCLARLLATGHLQLDDLGRVQIGYNLWTQDGRLLTALLMLLASFGGRMMDLSPGPQLVAVAIMGACGALLARSAPDTGILRPALAAILLFGTPFWLQNMSYVFDSASMAAAVLCGLLSVLLLARDRSGAAAAALLAALMLYQPAINVFLCFAAGEMLVRLAGAPRGALRLLRAACGVLLAAGLTDWLLIALLRATGLVVFPAYQTGHAALLPVRAMPHGLVVNLHAMLRLLARMLPPGGAFAVLALLLVAAALLPVLARLRGLVLAGGIAAVLVLLLGFAGPLLLLRDPVVQPRTLPGVGAAMAAAAWCAMRLVPRARAVPVLAALLAVCCARDALAYGALLRDLDRYEAERLPPIARALNAEHDRTGLRSVRILGALPMPVPLQHGLERAPMLAPLFDNPLNGISWFGVALLAEYGLEDGIWFREPGPVAGPCRTLGETGPGFSVGHDRSALILLFRSACS